MITTDNRPLVRLNKLHEDMDELMRELTAVRALPAADPQEQRRFG